MTVTYVPRPFAGVLILSGTPPPLSVEQMAALSHYVPSQNFAGITTPLYPTDAPYSYQVNGVMLQDYPTTMTAPSVQGKTVPQGSVFTLLFSSPSSATTSALADGSQVTLSFPVFGGQVVSGPVSCASTLTGSTFQVNVTTTAPIAVP